MEKNLRRSFLSMSLSCGKLLCGAGLILGLSSGMAQATYLNPFTTTPTVELPASEKQLYMEKKMESFGTVSADQSAADYVVPKGWQRNLESFQKVHLEKYTAAHHRNEKVILQIHGGGYIQGNHTLHRDWAIARAEAMGSGEVYMLDYRFYPEAQYPAALDDAVAAYQALLQAGIPPKNIVVMGDSAGGNLALALTLYLRDHAVAEPGALVLYSPWGDAGHLPTHSLNKAKDITLGERNPDMNAAVIHNNYYFRDADLQDPYVSPVYADFKGLPPMLIIAGGQELFVDDARLLEQRAREAGVSVETHLYPGMSHDWPLLFPELPEAQDAYHVLADFVKAH